MSASCIVWRCPRSASVPEPFCALHLARADADEAREADGDERLALAQLLGEGLTLAMVAALT